MEIDPKAQRIYDHLTKAADPLLAATWPIYVDEGREVPVHLGSCVLVKVSELFVIMTAAHVMDESKVSQLYLGVGNEIVGLNSTYHSTRLPPSGRRGADKTDLCVCFPET